MATQSGTLKVEETGEAEFLLPWRPASIQAMFVDGLSDANEASCANLPPDQLWAHVRTDKHKHYISVRWRIGKPRLISWSASS